MNINQMQFIEDLAISYPLYAYRDAKQAARSALEAAIEDPAADTTKKNQAFLNDKTIVSFVAGLSVESRQDVLDSTLLAQLAANHDFPGEDELKEWYQRYIEVLNNIGWNISRKSYEENIQGTKALDMQNVLLNIIQKAFTSDWVGILTSTLASMKGLSGKDHKIKMFEQNTTRNKKGAFQLSVASEKNGAVGLRMAGLTVTANTKILNLLFFNFNSGSATVSAETFDGTLNGSLYQNHRIAVRRKLELKSQQYVAEIEI
jgi:hypothetical protein